jgi:benzoyl-CoA reductase/2-hydroxyglutaryl-CoA dehydratase subunit BcrC/BadD/HgdB
MEISQLRRASSSLISSLEFVKLNHASLYADPIFMLDALEQIYLELKGKNTHVKVNNYVPRILLLGPNLSYGDYSVLEMVQEAGGNIVIEEISEGIRYYWNKIEKGDNIFNSLARGYLVDRVPGAFMSNSAGKRLDFTLKLIKDFNIAGVIWYELLCCETYDSESYLFAQKLKELKIPLLIIETDYSTSHGGQLKTRIEAFSEVLKGAVEQ